MNETTPAKVHPEFGIPTQSCVEDPGYQEAVKAEELAQKMGGSISGGYPHVATMQLHNHVVGAVSEAGLDVFEYSERIYKTGKFGSIFGRAAVSRLIHPEVVQGYQLDRIDKFEERLREAEPYMAFAKKVNGIGYGGRFYKDVPEGVHVKHMGTNSYQISLVPWDVLHQDLPRFRQEVAGAFGKDADRIRQIHSLWKVLDKYEDHAKLLGHYTPRTQQSLHRYEHDESSEAGRLYARHAAIAMKSDVYVDFSEERIHGRAASGGWSWSSQGAQGLIDQEKAHTDYSLWVRIGARDRAIERLKEKGVVRLHDTQISRPQGILEADKSPYRWALNLLGEPVAAQGEIYEPDDWVLEEKELVDAYRALPQKEAMQTPPHPLVRKICKRYEGYTYDDDSLRAHSMREVVGNVAYQLANRA